MLVFTMGSCKKDVSQSTRTTSSATSSIKNSFESVKDGRLVFKSMAALDSQVVALNVHQEEVYESWQTSINFKSYRTLERRAILTNWNNYCVKNDTLAPLVTYVEVPKHYVNVLNENREVTVNDSVYFFNGSNLYIISSNNESQLKATEKEIDNQLANGNMVTHKSATSNIRYVKLNINTFNSINQGNLKSTFANGYNFFADEWKIGSTSFNYVYEIQWSSYATLKELYIHFSKYLVYWNNSKGCWLIAGESCWKKYNSTSFYIYAGGGFSDQSGSFNFEYSGGWIYDNSFAGYDYSIATSGIINGLRVTGSTSNYMNTVPNHYENVDMKFVNGFDNNGNKLIY